jgi:hypothetical protein
MQTLDQASERAADLYWLAFLLTGQRKPKLDAATEELDAEEDANPFFSAWMHAWSRRLIIAKALAAICGELAASARRTAWERSQKSAPRLRPWGIDRHTTKVQHENALLAIDMFPKCAHLFSAFERISLEDAAVLLDADRRLVRKGQRSACGN